MLNKEKYAKEILDIVCSGDSLGKQNGHLCPCTNIKCSDCDFYTTLCCPEEKQKKPLHRSVRGNVWTKLKSDDVWL